MIYGYARVSTEAQDLAYQLGRLREAGCDAIIEEKLSAKDIDGRPRLNELMVTLKPGDRLLATVTDRVARDPFDMVVILRLVVKAGARLTFLDEPSIDSESDSADLMAYLYGWAARQHRLRILENTAHRRALAKARGVKFGRTPKLSPAQRLEVRRRRQNGEAISEVARAFRVSESTILRVSAC